MKQNNFQGQNTTYKNTRLYKCKQDRTTWSAKRESAINTILQETMQCTILVLSGTVFQLQSCWVQKWKDYGRNRMFIVVLHIKGYSMCSTSRSRWTYCCSCFVFSKYARTNEWVDVHYCAKALMHPSFLFFALKHLLVQNILFYACFTLTGCSA